ncbi:hypothetical protein BH23PLA1_BH23PLA1_33870 [soil metagenome]
MAPEFGRQYRRFPRDRPVRRCQIGSPPEALEPRALLSGLVAEVSGQGEDVLLDVSPEQWMPDPPSLVEAVDRWFGFADPWQIVGATVATQDRGNPPEMPRMTKDQLPLMGLGGLRELPMTGAIEVSGAIASGEGIDFYRLPVSPETLRMRVELWRDSMSTALEASEPTAETLPNPMLWLLGPDGSVLGRWETQAPAEGMVLDLRALRPPSEPFLILGVEAVGGGANGSSIGVPYTLGIQRQDRSVILPGFELPGFESLPVFAPGPPLNLVPPPLDQELAPRMDPGRMLAGTTFLAGQSVGTSSIGDPSATVEGLSLPARFDGSVGRPLPIQSAAPSTGSLPLGPPVRGETGSGSTDLRIEQVLDRIEEAAMDLGLTAASGESERMVGPVARPAKRPGSALASGLVTIPLSGGLPVLRASLRWPVRLSPSLVPIEEPEATVPVLAEAPPLPASGLPRTFGEDDRGQEASRQEASLLPVRPLTIRTALGVAVVLAVGLLLPDLGGVRSSLARPWGLLDRLRGRREISSDPPSTA